MNYIKALQEQNTEKGKALVAIQRSLNDMLVYLSGPKFTGTEQNGSSLGERKDWIATGDVKHFLMEIRQLTIV